MIDINLNNYEKFALDFLEGNLSLAERYAFLSFLKKNPDVEDDLKLLENINWSEDSFVFDEKINLKKQLVISDNKKSNFDELCIAKLENDLSEKENTLFTDYLRNNKLKFNEYKKYTYTVQRPDKSIVFNNKELIRRKQNSSLRKVYSIISVAATILLIVGLYFLINEQELVLQVANNYENSVKEEALIKADQSKRRIESSEIKIENKIKKISSKKDYETKPKPEQFKSDIRLEKANIKRANLLAKLQPKDIEITWSMKEIELFKPVSNSCYVVIDQSEYLSLSTFFRNKIKEKVGFKNERIGVFDVAKAGIDGVNSLFGLDMKLERTYTSEGDVDRTEFSSQLFAISTPSKNKN